MKRREIIVDFPLKVSVVERDGKLIAVACLIPDLNALTKELQKNSDAYRDCGIPGHNRTMREYAKEYIAFVRAGDWSAAQDMLQKFVDVHGCNNLFLLMRVVSLVD